MPKPSWPPQPWARLCPETALSPAAGLRCLGACPPRGREDRRAAPRGLRAALRRANRGLQQPCPALPGQGEVTTGGSDSCPRGTATPHPPVSACRSLPLPGFGGKGGAGNRTGSMAAAVLVGVIYVVYKSIKQSVLLSALHPVGALLCCRGGQRGAGTERGRDSSHPPTDSLVPIRIHFNHCCSV